MTQFTIKIGTQEEFFTRGRQLAQAADKGEAIAGVRIISFEDPADMMKLVTNARLSLLRAVKETPGSITDIATRLRRDRSAVKRDIDALERFGLVPIADKVLPGHGRMKEVRATASRLHLTVEVA